MVILEIDGQKYAGPSYIDGSQSAYEHRKLAELLAKETAETILLHFGYVGVAEVAAWTPTKEMDETV